MTDDERWADVWRGGGRAPLEPLTDTATTTPVVFYSDPAVVLYHGDAAAVLATLPRVDHVITDPPYDLKTHAGARWNQGRDADRITFDVLDVAAVVPRLLNVSARWVVAFCALEMLGDYQRAAGASWVRAGFWRRVDGSPQFSGDRPGQPGEGIAIMHRANMPKRWNGRGHHAYWEHGVVRADREHPTQKPEPLIAALVAAFTDPGDVVIDPFAGSGTTLVACKRLGRRAIGIEANADDCAVAARRLAQGSLDLFERTGDV